MTKLVADDTYTFTVAALNGSGTGPASQAQVTITEVPGAATSFEVVQSGPSSAALTWLPPTAAGASAVTGYVVTRDGTSTTGTGSYTKTLPASARSFTMTRLIPYFTYTFTVAAINASGTGPASTSQQTLST